MSAKDDCRRRVVTSTIRSRELIFESCQFCGYCQPTNVYGNYLVPSFVPYPAYYRLLNPITQVYDRSLSYIYLLKLFALAFPLSYAAVQRQIKQTVSLDHTPLRSSAFYSKVKDYVD